MPPGGGVPQARMSAAPEAQVFIQPVAYIVPVEHIAHLPEVGQCMIQGVGQRAFARPAEPRHPEYTPLLAHDTLPGGRKRTTCVSGQSELGTDICSIWLMTPYIWK